MLLKRDLRSKEIRIILAALLCAIICLTSISFTLDSVKRLLQQTSVELFGGDLSINTQGAASAELLQLAQQYNLRTTQTTSFYSMLTTKENFLLGSVRAVDENYPLKGILKINENGKVIDTRQIPALNEVWLEPRALTMLGVRVGDKLTIGAKEFTVAAVLDLEPDLIGEGFTFAPRVMINQQNLSATNAIVRGSRASFRLLLAGNQQNLDDFVIAAKPLLRSQQSLKYPAQNESRNANMLQQSENFLHLALCVNIILAAVVVCVTAKLYTAKHIYEGALMRCLGATRGRIVKIYGLTLLGIALAIGVVGSLIGYAIQQIASILASQALSIQLPYPGLMPLIIGCSVSVLLMVGLAIPAFYTIITATPMSILRQRNTLSNKVYWLSYAVMFIGMLIILYTQVTDKKLILIFTLGLGTLAAACLIITEQLITLLNLIFKPTPGIISLGCKNLYHNLRQNQIQIIAFSLVISVAMLLYIIRSDLISSWIKQLPANTPNYFAINIAPENINPLKNFLITHDIQASEFYPIVRGNLVKINEQNVSQEDEKPGERNGINRPLNLTWSANLPTDNKVVAGTWFANENAQQPVLSIEQSLAQRLNIKLNDTLTFRIGDDSIAAKVVNIRTLQWESFTPNFYIIYPPGVIDNYATTYMNSFYINQQQESLMLQLIKQFPEINLISTNTLLQFGSKMLNMTKMIVSYIWLFTITISLILLYAIIQTNLPTKILQNNLLRIFGANKQQIYTIVSIEFILSGVVAGLLGSCAALSIAWYVANYVMNLSFQIPLGSIALGITFATILVWISGILGSKRALRTAPILLFRESH